MRARRALLAAAALPAGRRAEVWQRTGYETRQFLRERECRQQRDTRCAPRQDYDSYQHQRST